MAKLYFRYGAMNSGKSANLLMVAHNYVDEKNKKILLVKPSIDTKGQDQVVCRMGAKRQVDVLLTQEDKMVNHLTTENVIDLDAILVDEAQFLTPTQVDEFYQIANILNIPVLCYGLRCDFRMKGFPGATRLLEIADSIEEIKTICDCGKKATQNLRMISDIPVFTGDQVAIDNGEVVSYTSVCANDYFKIREQYDPEFQIDTKIKELKRIREENK